MLKAWQKTYSAHQRLGHLTVLAILAAILASLPWPGALQRIYPTSLLGMDGGYFMALFAVPAILLAVALVHARRTRDNERHIRKFENE